MNNLVKNEIIKIVKKKSFYIILIVILAYIVLSNVMNKYVYDSFSSYDYYSEEYINFLKESIKNLDMKKEQDLEIYVGDKTQIDTYELLKKYDRDSWQYKIILQKAEGYLSEINTYTYRIKDEEALNQAKKEYDKFVERLSSNNWRSFTEEELESLKLSQEGLSENLKDPMVAIQIETLEMRLKYDIAYGDDYKNQALERYQQRKITIN